MSPPAITSIPIIFLLAVSFIVLVLLRVTHSRKTPSSDGENGAVRAVANENRSSRGRM